MTIEEMRKRKKELGLTYETLSERSGVPAATVQKVLGGITKSPRLDTVLALEHALEQYPENSDVFSRKGSGQDSSMLSDSPALYANYVIGSSARKQYEDCYPLLPYKRQGEYTAEDRDSLPEDVRTELIDGVLYDLAAPRNVHQIILGRMYLAISQCIEDHRSECLAFMAPSDVWLDRTDKTILQPDLYVLCDESMLEKDGYTHGAPPFVAEILSPSTAARDRSLKLHKYLSAGVREYWIVDPQKKRVIVYNFDDDSMDVLDPVIYTFDSSVPVRISEGRCSIDFSRINALLTRLGM